MSLQWTLVAGFLYAEIIVILLLILPIASPTKWQKLFKSRFLKSVTNQVSIYFIVLLGILVLLTLDAIREIQKHSMAEEHKEEHTHLDKEIQGNLQLFRAQRNFYMSSFALFLCLVIYRLVSLISAQATLLAQSEAAIRQAQSATTAATSLLSRKTTSESAQNDSNEAHDKNISELINQIKDLQTKNQELQNHIAEEKKDTETIKLQAESLTKEYDRLNDEHSKLLLSNGDKKSD